MVETKLRCQQDVILFFFDTYAKKYHKLSAKVNFRTLQFFKSRLYPIFARF